MRCDSLERVRLLRISWRGWNLLSLPTRVWRLYEGQSLYFFGGILVRQNKDSSILSKLCSRFWQLHSSYIITETIAMTQDRDALRTRNEVNKASVHDANDQEQEKTMWTTLEHILWWWGLILWSYWLTTCNFISLPFDACFLLCRAFVGF